MKYSPKHNDKTMRILYVLFFGAALIFMMLPIKEGIPRTVLICLSMASIVGAMYLLMRYELTTFTYILNPKGNDYDFFVDRAQGKRGNYVCSYRVSDIIKVEDYNKGTREAIQKEYPSIFIYNYTHNHFTGKKQIIVFRGARCEAVICELGDEMESFLKNVIELVKEAQRIDYNEDFEKELEEENE